MIRQLKLFICSCVAPKIRIFLAAVPHFGEKLWPNSFLLRIPFGNSCPELCLPLPAADPDKPFPLGWDLSKDRVGFVWEGITWEAQECWKQEMEAPGLGAASPPRSQGWNFWGSPGSAHPQDVGLGASAA